MLFRAAKALAALSGRDHALPDDVQELAPAVLTHRLLLAPDAAGDERADRGARRAREGPRVVSGRALGRLPARRSAAAALALGRLVLAGAVFDSASLYPPGVALLALSAGAVAWVAAGRTAVPRSSARPGPTSVVEEQPWPLRLRAAHRPAAGRPVASCSSPCWAGRCRSAAARSQAVRINVRFSRRGRRELDRARAGDPRPPAAVRAPVPGPGGEEVLVLPRRGAGDRRRRRGRAGVGPLTGHGGRAAAGGCPARRPSWTSTACGPTAPGASASRIHWPAAGPHGRDARASAGGRVRVLAAGGARRPQPRRARRRSTPP